MCKEKNKIYFSGSRERYRHARDQIYSLYEKFDKTEDESISGPITHFEVFFN